MFATRTLKSKHTEMVDNIEKITVAIVASSARLSNKILKLNQVGNLSAKSTKNSRNGKH